MTTSHLAVEAVRLVPTGGCGSLESPWTGWEESLEAGGPRAAPRTVRIDPGFWGVSRPVRLPGNLTLTADPDAEGRAWFLPRTGPGGPLDALFVVDGASNVTLHGICLNGRDDRARRGLRVRCTAGLQVTSCRFADFRSDPGAAIACEGESEHRPVRGVVVQDCHLVHATIGLSLGREVSDLLVTGNRFEEIEGPALSVDPADHWSRIGLIFVRNRVRATVARRAPFLAIGAGAEGIRIAESTFEGPGRPDVGDPAVAALDIHGGGPFGARRLEVMLNTIDAGPGPGIRARHCGPGFIAAGNRLEACGSAAEGAIQLVACHGVLVEDNDVECPVGPGIRATDCRRIRLNGNSVAGRRDPSQPRGGSVGVRVDGEGGRRLILTDNRVSGTRESGVRVDDGRHVRIVGNEVQDCGEGIHVARARNLLLVGNDCRDNGDGGLRVGREVRRGLVALNYAILNGSIDLEILGDRIRSHSNKVDREGRLPPRGAFPGTGAASGDVETTFRP